MLTADCDEGLGKGGKCVLTADCVGVCVKGELGNCVLTEDFVGGFGKVGSRGNLC